MRSVPSFIGDFHNQKRKPSTSRSSTSELPIEKEADLREKRKQQILQRLKHKAGHDDDIEIGLTAQKNLAHDEISEKVIFSPRTAKRFKEVNPPKRVESVDVRSKKHSQTEMPLIIVQETPKNNSKVVPETEQAQNHRKEISEHAIQRNKSTYVPSFADKSTPVRSAHGSPVVVRREKTYTHIARKTSSNLEEERSRERKAASLPASHQNSPVNCRRKNALPAQKPPLITSSSIEVTVDEETDSSPLRRSASFHSLKDRKKATMEVEGGRQLLAADDDVWKTWSLPSIRQQSNSMTSLVDYDNLSSTKSLKLQQDKLEQEFHRLEEDLDRAFSELRKLLKTG